MDEPSTFEDAGAAAYQRGWRRGERIAMATFEAGLGARPWALWLGPPGLSELLSPYTRDNAAMLAAWVSRYPAAVAQLVPELLPDSSLLARRARLCAVAAALLADHPALKGEREAAERTVGITKLSTLGTSVIDSARIDWGAVVYDAHAPNGSILRPELADLGLVLLELGDTPGSSLEDAASLAALVTHLGARAQAVVRVMGTPALSAGRARLCVREPAPAAQHHGDASLQNWRDTLALLRHEQRLAPACQTTELEAATDGPMLAGLRAAAMWLSSSKR